MAGATWTADSCQVGNLQDHRLRVGVAGLLVKLKPDDASVVDYLHRLRARYTPESSSLTARQHSDKRQLSTWKAKCTHTERKLAKSQEVIIQLGKENQRLQEELEDLKISKANSQKKRKRSPSSSRLDESWRQHGRNRLRNVSQPNCEPESASIGYLELSISSPEVDRCLGNLYIFQTICTQLAPNMEDLASISICLSQDCVSLVMTIAGTTSAGNLPTRHQPVATRSRGLTIITEDTQSGRDSAHLRLVRATFSKILLSLNVLHTAGAAVQHDRVAYQVTRLFSTLLDLSRVKGSVACHKGTLAKANKGRKRARLTQDPLVQPESEWPFPSMLCRLLVELLEMVLSDRDDHHSIWDGVLFDLLTRVGTILRTLVFGESEGDIGRQEISGQRSPNDGQQGIASEAPVLVWLMRSILRLHGLRKTVSSTGDKYPKGPGSLDADLNEGISGMALSKLQGTLLKAVFPNDCESFRQSFIAPLNSLSEENTTLPSVSPVDVPNWFKSEVWRLIGWDMLWDMIDWDS